MHIAFLTSEYPPLPSGGIGTSVRNLARALVAQGHRVTVLGWGYSDTFEDQGVQVRFLGHTSVPKMGWMFNRCRARQALQKLVHEERLEIVEAQDWCGISAGIALDCPIVIRCNGSATYFGHLLHEPVRTTIRLSEQLALRQAHGVAAVSSFTATLTEQLFHLKQPVVTIPNGIDIAQFQSSICEDTDPHTILYLGSLVRKKGVLDLGPIFSRVVAMHPEARLRLVGRDVPDKQTGAPSTWALCQKLLSPEAFARTEYLGPKPYAQVQEYIRKAAVCIFPSYAEALPLSWLEVMACAKPIVAYDIGWAKEVVEPGISGFLISPNDVEQAAQKLVDLLCNTELRNRQGVAAKQRVAQEFAAEVVARQSVEWYRSVLAR